MYSRKRCGSSVFVALMLSCTAAHSHHAATEYDYEKTIEIEGTLTEVRWQNPHVRVKVRSTAVGSSTPIVWDIEGGSVSILRRTNMTASQLRVGEQVRVAGHASRRSPSRMFGTNLLRADGTELVFLPEYKPRWQRSAIGTESPWYNRAALESSRAGIFRVWSSHLHDFFLLPEKEASLTEAARAERDRWDFVNDSVAQDCEPLGMPLIMDQPYPIEFVARDDRILLRFEADEVVRTIYMRTIDRSSLPKHIHGRSTGRWEGATLVVETDGVTWRYLDHAGTPLSESVQFLERFTPSEDGKRLKYSVRIEDPANLSEPLVMRREWLARSNEQLAPYNCVKQ